MLKKTRGWGGLKDSDEHSRKRNKVGNNDVGMYGDAIKNQDRIVLVLFQISKPKEQKNTLHIFIALKNTIELIWAHIRPC